MLSEAPYRDGHAQGARAGLWLGLYCNRQEDPTRPFPFAITFVVSATALVAAFPEHVADAAPTPVERVVGIGGFFFRAKDPTALAKWYEDHLGVTRTPTDYHREPWRQAAGPTIFQPFPATSKFFERAEQQFIVNFRVTDLDGMVTQLKHDGIAVEVDPELYPNGRFALTHDPEGNPIQLWQEKR